MTLKVRILICSRRLFIILVSLTMTWFSEKMLISTRCIHGFMSKLIKKSWTDSNTDVTLSKDKASWPLVAKLLVKNGIFFSILGRYKEEKIWRRRMWHSKQCPISLEWKIVMTRFLQMIEVKTIASKGPSRLSIYTINSYCYGFEDIHDFSG